jgi:hypothetical protein
MKLIKRLLIAILGLSSLFLIIALFVDGNYSVERQIIIRRPVSDVFEYVKNLKNQEEYSVWKKIDPTMKKSYIGKDGTVGFVSAWESNNEKVGKGEQEIIKIVEGKRLDMEVRIFEPYESKDNSFISTEKLSQNSTKVTWGFTGKMNYPSNIFLLFTDIEKLIGNDLGEGLSNLKNQLER